MKSEVIILEKSLNWNNIHRNLPWISHTTIIHAWTNSFLIIIHSLFVYFLTLIFELHWEFCAQLSLLHSIQAWWPMEYILVIRRLTSLYKNKKKFNLLSELHVSVYILFIYIYKYLVETAIIHVYLFCLHWIATVYTCK